jgi:acid stress-induced BolA-like protein IbaG/YrbA
MKICVNGMPLLHKDIGDNDPIYVNYMFVNENANKTIVKLTMEAMTVLENVTEIKYIHNQKTDWSVLMTKDNPLLINVLNCTTRNDSDCRRGKEVIATMRSYSNHFMLLIFTNMMQGWSEVKIKHMILHELLHMVHNNHFNDSQIDALYPFAVSTEFGLGAHELDLLKQQRNHIGIGTWDLIMAARGPVDVIKFAYDPLYRNMLTLYFEYCRLLNTSLRSSQHLHCESSLNLFANDSNYKYNAVVIIENMYECVFVEQNVLQLCFGRALAQFNDPIMYHRIHEFNQRIDTRKYRRIHDSMAAINRNNIHAYMNKINNCKDAHRAECMDKEFPTISTMSNVL